MALRVMIPKVRPTGVPRPSQTKDREAPMIPKAAAEPEAHATGAEDSVRVERTWTGAQPA